MSNRSLARLVPLIFLTALASLTVGGAAPAQGASFTVDTTHDAVDAAPGDGVCADAGGACTLRAAVMEANALAGADEISLPAGTYVLSIPGAGEDASATGDLDVHGGVTISGAGSVQTLIDGNALDRVLDNIGPLVSLEDLALQNGDSGMSGGAGLRNAGELALNRVSIVGNHGDHTGAGVDNGGILTGTQVRVSNNTSRLASGGGIFSVGTVTLSSSVIELNTADREGGGISNAGTLTLNESIVESNSSDLGGGIHNWWADSVMWVTNTTIRNNSASSGGGFFNSGTLTVSTTTVSGNTALADGGGVSNNPPPPTSFGTPTLVMVNSTVSANTASVGGGIHSGNAGGEPTVSLTNVTVADNVASTNGGGISNGTNSRAGLKNTIVAVNPNGGDCAGPITSLGHNLDSDGKCGLTAPGDVSNVDPLLLPLANNGGPTQTHALRASECGIDSCTPGSPAIDAADNAACPATDQRGVARPFDGDGDGTAVCDIGAHENDHGPAVCGCLPTSSPSPAPADGAPSPAARLPTSLPATGGGAGSDSAVHIVLATTAAAAVAGAVWRARRSRHRMGSE